MEWWIQGNPFQVDAKLLNFSAYDVILGMDYLEQYNPMNCVWLLKWTSKDKLITGFRELCLNMLLC